MQKNEYTEQDLQIRSLMQDAEEKVPSRVWASVFWRLKGIHAAVPVLAFACCALAAVLVVNKLAMPSVSVSDSSACNVGVLSSEGSSLLCQASIAEPSAIPARKVLKHPESKNTIVPSNPAQTIYDAEPVKQIVEETNESEWERLIREDVVEHKQGIHPVVSAHANVGANDSRFYGTIIQPSFAGGTKTSALQEKSVSTYGIPVSAGLGIAFSLNEKFMLGTGVNWTSLSREFEGSYKTEEGTITHKMHYVGVPVNCYYNIFDSHKAIFYVYGGAEVEKCLSNKYYMYATSTAALYETTVNRLQWSVGAGAGVQYKLTSLVSFYFDPSARFYFDCGQPYNLRTDKPLNISLEAGIRFTL